MSPKWERPLEDVPRNLSPAKKKEFRELHANLLDEHRQALMGAYPDTLLSRKIIRVVAGLTENAFNQAALTKWAVRMRTVGHERQRPGGKHAPREWKVITPTRIGLDGCKKHIERVGQFLGHLGPQPYLPDDATPATVNPDLAYNYLQFRRNAAKLTIEQRKEGGHLGHLDARARNWARQSIHHFINDLHGTPIADVYQPWKMENITRVESAGNWSTRARKDEIIEAFGDDEWGLIVQLCSCGFSPKTARTRRRDDIRFPGGRLAVRTKKGWFVVPIDPKPFMARKAAMLEVEDDGYLVRGPMGDGEPTLAQYHGFVSARGLFKGSALSKISKWGQANLLLMGYDPLYVARLAESREKKVRAIFAAAKLDARPGDYDNPKELYVASVPELARCQHCHVVQALSESNYQRCVHCHQRLNRSPLDPLAALVLSAQSKSERYAHAVGRSIDEEARRLLNLMKIATEERPDA